TLWNPSAERKFGWTAEEVLGNTLAETIVPPQHRLKHIEGLKLFLESGAATIFGKRLELTALRKSGEEFDIELAVAPYKTEEGHYFVGFIRDITDRKRSQAALEELNVSLEQRIADRTNQLERVNTDLKREIAHRVRAEDTIKRSRQDLQEYVDSMS